MKILHISTTDDGGAGTCCLRIHQSLLEQGIESQVMVLKKTCKDHNIHQYGRGRDMLFKLPSLFLYKFSLCLTEYDKIKKLQKGNKAYTLPVSHVDVTTSRLIEWADIIHLHWVNGFVDYPSFFQKIKKPIVWTLHDENLFYGIAHLHKDILLHNPMEIKYRKIKELAIKNAHNLTIVFLSEMMLKDFGNEKIIAGRKKTVINNSVNTAIFHPLNKRDMRRKYGLNENTIMFVFISMNILDPNKGLQILSDALLDVAPDSKIIAVGSNPGRKEWKNVISMGLISGQQQMCELISCADYLAMPSYQEAFSQSPLQAMACGLPVVAFPVSGTSELINEKNGIVCDDFTKKSLEDGIQKLLRKNYNTHTIRQYVINKFSPKVIASKYVSIYSELLKDNG